MPTYIYGCRNDPLHPTLEIDLSYDNDPEVACPVCGGPMGRIPQKFRFGFNPFEILTDWMDDNYRRWRTGQPRTDVANRPSTPLPGKDFNTRS
jgi:hypothetical protein